MAAALALAPAAAQAEWRRYETSHFIVYSEQGSKEATRLAEGLERIDGLMRMATGLKPDTKPVKVRIYQVATEYEVEKTLGDTTTTVAGFYENNILGPFAVTPRKVLSAEGDFTPDLVLHHEYAHHFMLQYFPATYPSWYTEGFAELIGSSTPMSDGRIAYGMAAKHRRDGISFDWVPVDDLLTKPPEQIKEMDLYGQGWAMTHFLTFNRERSPQLRKYLTALTAGMPSADAAKAAFGNLTQLNRDAHRYLDIGDYPYTPVAVPIAKPVIEREEAVSAGEAALIPETIAFRDDDLAEFRKESDRGREKKLRDDEMGQIRAKAARFPDDPYALYMLAIAEHVAGNLPGAEAAADRLLALQPNHARGMVVKSLCLAQSAGNLAGAAREQRAAQARALAIKANHADPDDPLPFLAVYQSYHLAGLKPTAEAVDNLASASATLPHDNRIRMLLVEELSAEGRWSTAMAVLMPIANNTHASPAREAARALMAKLQAEAGKGAG
jgi:hypothetical protein